MNLPKYEVAYFKNDEDVWEPVSFRELHREERRAELRTKELRDKPEGSYQLGIRNHPKTPHFYEMKPIRFDIEPGVTETEEHTKEQRIICSFLNKYTKHELGYYERPWDEENKGYESFAKLRNYHWEKEVKFGLVYGKFVLFDIFGRSSSEISLTDKNPLVAIEVVDTHFHSKEAFKALLETSKNLPLIVGYMFLLKKPRLNTIKGVKNSNWFCKNRVHCYISDGSFWFRNERVEDLYDVNPREPEVYYNLIKEQLYEQGFIRTKP